MSSNLMDTEAGGEQTQYEAAATEIQSHKKSTGQLGDPASNTTTDPSNTQAQADQAAERGQRTAENIRYGQTISEGGMGGMTAGQAGQAEEGGFGRIPDRAEGGDGVQERVAAGYGGAKDMDRDVGA